MSSNKKFALSLTAMVLVAVIAVVTIVAVFAAKTQQLSTNISVRYRADQIEGSVTAKYYVGPNDKQGTNMTTGEEGETTLTFHAKDTTMEGKSLSPQENIELQYPDDGVEDKSWVVFEYVFHNGLGNPIDTAYMATMSFDGTAENIKITTADSEEQITSYEEISNKVDNPKSFTVSASVPKKAEDNYISTKYVYIKAEIDDPGTDSQFKGSFNWSLGYDMATYEKLEFTADEQNEYMLVSAKSGTAGEIIVPSKYQGKPVKIEKATYETHNRVEGDHYSFSGSFTNAKNVTSITFPEGITEIPDYTFARDKFIDFSDYDDPEYNLEELILPNSLTSLGEKAFFGVENLKRMHIGSGMTDLSGGLPLISDKVTVDSNNTRYTSRDGKGKECNVVVDKDTLTLIRGTNNSIIPSDLGITTIGEGSFYNCRELKSLEIPNSVTKIEYGFSSYNNEGLKNISIGSGIVDSDSMNNLLSLDHLDYITIDENNPKYKSKDESGKECYVVVDKDTYTLIKGSNNGIIPDDGSVTSIAERAFYNCNNLNSVKIPESITSIGEYAFNKCTSLGEINIPNALKTIGDYSFEECSTLQSVSITTNSELDSIGNYAFHNCTSLENINIPNSVTNVGDWAFYGCSAAKTLTIGEGVKTIGRKAFHSCTSLTEVTYNAIDCADLKGGIWELDKPSDIFWEAGKSGDGITVTIGESVTHIPSYLFGTDSKSYGAKITSLTIGSNVASIGNSAFCNSCDSLTTLNFNAINCEDFVSSSNIFLYITKAEVVFGENVTKIPNYLFYGIEGYNMVPANIQSVTIGSNVETIGNYSFYNCSNLTSVRIPEHVNSIGQSAFAGCSHLTSVRIPEHVNSIGQSAFAGCSHLTDVEISSGLTSLGNFTFSGCGDLRKVEIPDTITFIGPGAFDNCNSLEFYTEGYCNYLGNQENNYVVLMGLTDKKQTSYTINPKCKIINDKAFYASDVADITIPDSVVYIGANSFYYCENLTSIEIPNSVTSIADTAFNSSENLNEVIINSSSIYVSNNFYTNCIKTVKVLATADDGSNEYLNNSFTKSEQQENIGGKMYNVYTKN